MLFITKMVLLSNGVETLLTWSYSVPGFEIYWKFCLGTRAEFEGILLKDSVTHSRTSFILS